jgi:hypothetical protein
MTIVPFNGVVAVAETVGWVVVSRREDASGLT